MKIRRRSKFRIKSYYAVLNDYLRAILSSSKGPKSRHFRQAEINTRVCQTEAEDFPFNRLIHIKLSRNKGILILHTTLLISKSPGVEI